MHPKRYREVDIEEVLKTIETLQRRISQRFPDADLRNVCAELLAFTHETGERSDWIARPNYILRIGVFCIVIGALAALLFALQGVDLRIRHLTLVQFIEVSGAAVNTLVLAGAALLSLLTVESRVKRYRALKSLHELRALAHVIDMHQLQKDPGIAIGPATESSPKRYSDAFLTGRYLDYCSEMLSLTGKVAVLYAQRFPDSAVIEAVNEIEMLTTGLSRKIWQKLTLMPVTSKLEYDSSA